MNWRKILFSDIRTLRHGGETPRPGVQPRRRPWRGPRYASKSTHLRHLLHVTEQLSVIVHANAPLAGGLEAAGDDAPKLPTRMILLTLRDDLDSGHTLAKAMALRPRFFPKFYVDLVKAGEETGSLDNTLSSLQEILTELMVFRNRWAGYLYYVGTNLAVGLGIGLFMVTHVAPVFVEIIRDLGAEPSATAQAYIRLHEHLKSPGTLMSLFAAACVVLILFKLVASCLRMRNLIGRAAWAVLLHIPVVGTLLTKEALGHMARALEKLLLADVPLDDALACVGQLDIPFIYSHGLARVRDKVRSGFTLKDAMKEERVFPPGFVAFVSLGESSGRLPEVTGWIGRIYRRETLKVKRVLMDTISPLGIVALAAFVLFTALATLGNIMHIGDVVLDSIYK